MPRIQLVCMTLLRFGYAYVLFLSFVSVGICSIFVFLPGSTSYTQNFRYTIKDDQNHAPS
jgi:hypothetical protein